VSGVGGATTAAVAGIDTLQHLIFIVQENRSFDHYFGSYKGVRGFDDRSAPGGIVRVSARGRLLWRYAPANPADLLEEVAAPAPEGRECARQLRALLARKNAVEYESRKASAKEAHDGVERAGRIVDWAKDVVAKARL